MEQKKEPVIVFQNVADIVKIEDIYEFSVKLTLGLSDGNDFYLVIEFQNLSQEDYKTLTELWQKPNRLKFSSKLIKKENYNISHIVVTKFNGNSLMEMSWECLSDDPELYNLIIE
ncbi:hypothetical protein BZL53_00770 [Flavobacterium columnare]|uniref:hypothetical protein n=1 Tax=Flavobacterium columnare TaxID=996 RepID=UPI000981548A|nr:hypothetical protein [Flavobacterium columnare]OOB83653.1 hypothetical protein BZL53_00770 [Flavobacterium columnare]